MQKRYFGGYPRIKDKAIESIRLKCAAHIKGLADEDLKGLTIAMKTLGNNELYVLRDLLVRIFDYYNEMSPVNDEESSAYFDRYIAGDR